MFRLPYFHLTLCWESNKKLFCSFSGLYTFGYPIEGREHLDHWNNSVLLLHPTDSFSHSGHVHSWHFFANRTVNLTLQVWRPITTSHHSHSYQYKLVGQNFYNVSTLGIQNVVLLPKSRIPFQEGDLIGVYFPSLNPIPFSKRSAECLQPILYLHLTHPQLERTYPFRAREAGWNPCRIYSIHLRISNSSKCCAWCTRAVFMVTFCCSCFFSFPQVYSQQGRQKCIAVLCKRYLKIYTNNTRQHCPKPSCLSCCLPTATGT